MAWNVEAGSRRVPCLCARGDGSLSCPVRGLTALRARRAAGGVGLGHWSWAVSSPATSSVRRSWTLTASAMPVGRTGAEALSQGWSHGTADAGAPRRGPHGAGVGAHQGPPGSQLPPLSSLGTRMGMLCYLGNHLWLQGMGRAWGRQPSPAPQHGMASMSVPMGEWSSSYGLDDPQNPMALPHPSSGKRASLRSQPVVPQRPASPPTSPATHFYRTWLLPGPHAWTSTPRTPT